MRLAMILLALVGGCILTGCTVESAVKSFLLSAPEPVLQNVWDSIMTLVAAM